MMKRWIALLLLCAAAGLLSACGDNGTSETVKSADKTADYLSGNKSVGQGRKMARKRGNVFFFNKVSHYEISSFYYYAALHVLLSLRESPGLVSLEAASMGCPIVISSDGFLPKDSYFPDAPYVVNPLDVSAIQRTVLKAYKEKLITEIDKLKFSWSEIARQTYKVYEELVSCDGAVPLFARYGTDESRQKECR